MNVEFFEPSERLKTVVKNYMVIKAGIATPTVVLPHYGFVLAIQFAGSVSVNSGENFYKVPAMALSGMRKSSRNFLYEKNTSTILVMFTETGAAAIFKQPLTDFFEHAEDLQNLFATSEVNSLQDQISSAQTNNKRIAIIESYLTSKLLEHPSDILVSSAINTIHSSYGIIPINILANNYTLSIDAFEKRFKKVVGATPKQFSTLVRLKKLVANGYGQKSLTGLAYEYEFYDQAHFVRQFKSFTGQLPKTFLKTAYSWQ